MAVRPFRMKSHVQGRERLLAACDADLVGKEFAEGHLRLKVMPEFYDEVAGDAAALESYLRRCTVANLVGKKTVELAIELGFVDPNHVLRIQGVPHAQWALML